MSKYMFCDTKATDILWTLQMHVKYYFRAPQEDWHVEFVSIPQTTSLVE